ncbi:hypothetical protein FisN_12Hh182 [Fistulifera solaris]|uniref:Nuclear pore complex protein Nup153 n=1 Tax=Fistulifera solaris TaxID=1519565 RepID=A0A1Z5KBE2_FISSO|nr:hypothetical protein FisN_12Hh182 [Fistulifera solaris]|eukprot:GAX23610.1 hypothetical protein FisN_12Hh182 [Fistulifera solaris]
MSLKDFLKFEPVASPLSGATALTQSSRPTKSGVKLLAVPTNCLGYAFRVCNETLEILALSSEIGASILFSTSLGIPAVNVAASPDGRLVAVCLADGSLCCFDVTNESFQLRWKVEGAHSHTEIDLNQSVSTSRENAAGAAGPARSLQFSPQGYALALVDDGQQGLTIYHADDCGTPVESVQRQLAYLNLACAAWSPSCDSDECTIAVGTIDGNGIHVFNYNTATSRLSPVGVLPFPGEADDGPLWSCTHIEWVADGSSLGCGYCRVLPPEEDVKEDEDDPDDAAQHQVCFYISSFPSDEKPPQNMGDVVPFFAPAKDGRHVFFTTTVANNSQCNIMLVASNVGSDVHVLSGEDPSSWVEVELPEGDNASTPTDEDYEFTYPTGLAVANVIQEEGCRPLVLLLSTDGSLSCFQLVHGANESFFQLPLASGFNQLQAVPLPKSMRSEAAPELVREDASLPVADVKANLFGQETKASFGFGGLSLASTPPKSSLEASGAQQSVFGRSTFDQTISATIASTSSLSFGTGSAFGANVPSSTQPVFGQTSSLLGPQSAPFGSGSEVTFGSGSASLSFGSGDAKNVFGSSVLSSKPFSFGALASSPAGFAQSADPFNTFKKPASSAFGLSSITKPLFGTTTEEIKPEEQPELSSATMEAPSQVLPIEPAVNSAELRQDSKSDRDESASTPEAKKAAEAFDTIDSDKKGILPLNKMEDLIENLGEGFYGDELAKQTKLVDKDDKGHLERQAFIDWYVQLLSGGDDGGSSGGSEESDQREERERAQAKFQELSSIRNGVRSISEMDFPKLIESLGTTYCEEEHRRTIRKLKDSSGIITENAFVSWYIDWLFGGDESDVEDSEEEEDEVDGVVTNELVATGTGWGNIFKAEEGSWKCSVCMVLNPGETGKCKACEAVRPGTKNDATTASMGTGGGTQESSGSSIAAVLHHRPPTP